jgi:transcriptional regulator with XRE-family HTH domain
VTSEVVPFPSRPRPDEPRPKLRDVVGEVLRDERQRQGRTLADVADAAAVSLQYLSEIERGTKEVSSDLLDAVHTALGLDLGTVLERANRRLAVRSQRGGVLRMLAA